jgi:hypothetical protein
LAFFHLFRRDQSMSRKSVVRCQKSRIGYEPEFLSEIRGGEWLSS